MSLFSAVLGRRLEKNLRGLMVVSKFQLLHCLRMRFRWLPWQTLLRSDRKIVPRSSLIMPAFTSAGRSPKLLLFGGPSSDDDDGKGGDGSGGGGDRKFSAIHLMDYGKLRWPHPIKSLRNYIFAALIRMSFDQEFSLGSFLAGAEQVIWLSWMILRLYYDCLIDNIVNETLIVSFVINGVGDDRPFCHFHGVRVWFNVQIVSFSVTV